MIKAVVKDRFDFKDIKTGEDMCFCVGDIIRYERYSNPTRIIQNACLESEIHIVIYFDGHFYYAPDFNIEIHVIEIKMPLPLLNYQAEPVKELTDKINEEIQYTKDCNQAFQLGKESAFSNQHVQIERIESVTKVNKFLSNIKRENVIDIKPMEHNTYLVIYAEENK